jgi:hypothetical protein
MARQKVATRRAVQEHQWLQRAARVSVVAGAAILAAGSDGVSVVLAYPSAVVDGETGANAPASRKSAAGAPKITYTGGQLKIEALNSTMAEVLAKVSSLTGVKIEVPEGASTERMPIVELGPGPAREVLASLLSDSDFDYLLLASDADSDKLESVVLMPRGKRGTPAGPGRSPFSQVARTTLPPSPKPDEQLVAENSAPAPAENTTSPATTSSAAEGDPPPASAPRTVSPVPLTPDPSNRPGALTPPSSLTPQSMSQQLQQMYQQRMQLNQQQQSLAGANPGNGTGK